MMSYPLESEKGRAFAWFWTIFNLGGVVGSLIPLGQNINRKDAASVQDGTYIAFIVLMFSGAVLALFLCNADNVIRSDGSRVVLMKNPSWSSEFVGLWKTIVSDPYILLLFPMFWSSNWFTTYQTNSVNGAFFNIRTRSLNSLLYWFSQMIGAIVFGNALDIERFKRTTRAKASLIVLFVLTFAIWGGGYKWQTGFTREDKPPLGDWKDKGYLAPMFLYMFYGFYDAAWQCCVYWYAPPNPFPPSIHPIKQYRAAHANINPGTWARSPTTAARWPTTSASTRASNPPAPPSCGPSTRTRCPSWTSSSPTGCSWPARSSSPPPSSSCASRSTCRSRRISSLAMRRSRMCCRRGMRRRALLLRWVVCGLEIVLKGNFRGVV